MIVIINSKQSTTSLLKKNTATNILTQYVVI